MFPSQVLWRASSNPSRAFNRYNTALLDRKSILSGNNVGTSERNPKRTRRNWMPNLQSRDLWSPAMQNMVNVKLTTSALKTIKKKGGLDEYLLTTREDRLGMKGLQLRGMLHDALKAKNLDWRSYLATKVPDYTRSDDGKGYIALFKPEPRAKPNTSVETVAQASLAASVS